MRVTATIAPGGPDLWSVTFELQSGPGPPPRSMRRLGAAPWLMPTAPPETLGSLCDDTTELAATSRRVHESGEVEPEDPVAFGRLLFEALLGGEAWKTILTAAKGQPFVELALACPDESTRPLHGLAWELMHDGMVFLTAAGTIPLVVTRVVSSPAPAPAKITSPARILFAIGAELTDLQIRPGAEFMGLIRQLERRGASIQPYVIDQASLTDIEGAVQRFRPDIVHFIAHGRISEGQPVLDLKAGEHDEGDRHAASAEQLASVLLRDSALPPIVVLSACSTATADRVVGAHATSLAARLVRAGVPLVVAMSGRVADSACRLFTRHFGDVLVDGRPIAEAMACGRRAAFVGGKTPPARSVDWALPALFAAESVPDAFAPVSLQAGPSAAKLLHDFGLSGDPMFCGRRGFFERYEQLMDAGHPVQTVVVHTAAQKGVGEKRLLKELAAHALRDGHVPVMVWAGLRPPHTLRGLALALLRATRTTRANLGLPPPTDSLLLRALLHPDPLGQLSDDPDTRNFELAALTDDLDADARELGPSMLKNAAGVDLRGLVADAKDKLPAAPGTRLPLVLLEGVEWWTARCIASSSRCSTITGSARRMPRFPSC